MNSRPGESDEACQTARRLCEASAWPELLEYAQTWQKNRPGDYKAFYYMALAHAGMGQFVQAETTYRRALELNDLDAKVWGNLGGLLYERSNRPLEGIRCVERALKLNPTHKLGWANLASMVGRLGDHTRAMAFADRAIELDSDFVEAYLHKGAAARALGKTDVLREVCAALSAIPAEKFHRAR